MIFLLVAAVGLAYALQQFRSDLGSGAAVSGTLVLGCLEELPQKELRVSQPLGQPLRVRGRFCAAPRWREPGNPTLRLRNLATGRTATIVFHGDGQRFVTEEIATHSGTNSLMFEWRDGPESELRTAVVDVVVNGVEENPAPRSVSAAEATEEEALPPPLEATPQKR